MAFDKKAYITAWRVANREYMLQYYNDRYQANKERFRKEALDRLAKKISTPEGREKYLDRKRKYYRDNYEKVMEYAEQYNEKNRELLNAKARDYTQRMKVENPALYKLRSQTNHNTRRCRELNAPGFCSVDAWSGRCSMFLWRCAYCGHKLTAGTISQDHVIPLAKGGSNWPSNLVPACFGCNTKKQARTWIPNAFYKRGRLVA